MSAEARPTGAETEREMVVQGEWDTDCPHDAWTGMEGPASTLPDDLPGHPRWPLLWACDGCGTLGVTTAKGTTPVRARLRSTATPGEGEAIGYVVLQKRDSLSDGYFFVASSCVPLEVAKRIAGPWDDDYTVHPVGPALSPEPEEGA